MFQLKYHRWVFSELKISTRQTQKQRLWMWIACKSQSCIVMHLLNRHILRTYHTLTIRRHLPPQCLIFNKNEFQWEAFVIIICELGNIRYISSSIVFPILILCEILAVMQNQYFGIWCQAQHTANSQKNLQFYCISEIIASWANVDKITQWFAAFKTLD